MEHASQRGPHLLLQRAQDTVQVIECHVWQGCCLRWSGRWCALAIYFTTAIYVQVLKETRPWGIV